MFMPRIDLWAVETIPQFSEDESDSSSLPTISSKEVSKQMVETQDFGRTASQAWSSFIEQVESVSVNTSLVILVKTAPCGFSCSQLLKITDLSKTSATTTSG